MTAFSRYRRTRCYRFGWAFERAGWLLLAAIVIGAGLGLFGTGWLSAVEKTHGDTVVTYARFARARTPFVLAIEWSPRQRAAVVAIDRAYLAGFAVTEVKPAPAAESFDARRVYYSFRAREPAARITVELELRAKRGGIVVGSVAAADDDEIVIRQWIFP